MGKIHVSLIYLVFTNIKLFSHMCKHDMREYNYYISFNTWELVPIFGIIDYCINNMSIINVFGYCSKVSLRLEGGYIVESVKCYLNPICNSYMDLCVDT